MQTKLQNNFTSVEQSKRLLELGVPADSADCGIIEDIMHGGREILTIPYSEWCRGYESISLPCWSVGRLIEIDMICDTKEHDTANGCALAVNYYAISDNFNIIDWCVNEILDRYNEGRYDFSKLDD